MTTAIITMAGFGRRFLEAGYSVPKYRISVHGRTLFGWSMLSLKGFIEERASFVFVVREADEAKQFIEAEARALGIAKVSILELEAPTDGQATSAMLAAPLVAQPDEPMLVYNIDTFVHPKSLRPQAVRGEGWIPCFHADGDGWSFAVADADGRVSELREKVRVSSNATVGLYWFSSFSSYAAAYGDYYRDGANMERGERYIAPLYNELISRGRPVFIHDVPVDDVIPLGVPSDVERFRSSIPPRL